MVKFSITIDGKQLEEVTHVEFPTESEMVIRQNFTGKYMSECSDDYVEFTISHVPDCLGMSTIQQKYTGQIGDCLGVSLAFSTTHVTELETRFTLTSPMRLKSIGLDRKSWLPDRSDLVSEQAVLSWLTKDTAKLT